jgi:hypothetical protein
MSNTDLQNNTIFESPDGGKTVYARKYRETDRTLYSIDPELQSSLDLLKEDKLWGEIRRAAKSNKVLQDALERVILIYQLSKDHGTK